MAQTRQRQLFEGIDKILKNYFSELNDKKDFQAVSKNIYLKFF